MIQPNDIYVDRFTGQEINTIMYSLLGCMILAIVVYIVGAWMAVSSGKGFFSSLARPRRSQNRLRRIDESELKPWQRSSRRGVLRSVGTLLMDGLYFCFGWIFDLFHFSSRIIEQPKSVNTPWDDDWDVDSVKTLALDADCD